MGLPRLSLAFSLTTRAASVSLKERGRLILWPLSTVHVEEMLKVREARAVVMPLVMAFCK